MFCVFCGLTNVPVLCGVTSCPVYCGLANAFFLGLTEYMSAPVVCGLTSAPSLILRKSMKVVKNNENETEC